MKKTIVTLLVLASLAVPVSARPAAFQLCSPRNDDHFAVSKPLLFWQSSAGASRYEVYVDNVKIGGVPAAPVPVINYSPETPFSVGSHRWFVKAISASGEAVASGNFTFTVEASTNWPAWAIGPFVRYGENPIISPQGEGWESINTLSPGVVFDDGIFRMLYRAQGRAWTSREGYAESTDGVTFVRKANPVIDATQPFEKRNGCEDARLFHYQGTYYAFYTGNDPKGNIAICEATSPNAITWEKLGPVVDHTKNAAVVCDPSGTPVKIKGKFAMFCGNSNFKLCYSDDLVTWGPATNISIKFPRGWVTPYEPCVAVTDPSSAHPDNIVLFIAGTLNGKGKWFYAISEVLFNRTDLTKNVEQLDDCIMNPREPYESGQQKNSLWTNCIIQRNGQWMLYYAAGDRYVGLATAPVK